jgi:hypothetical protein
MVHWYHSSINLHGTINSMPINWLWMACIESNHGYVEYHQASRSKLSHPRRLPWPTHLVFKAFLQHVAIDMQASWCVCCIARRQRRRLFWSQPCHWLGSCWTILICFRYFSMPIAPQRSSAGTDFVVAFPFHATTLSWIGLLAVHQYRLDSYLRHDNNQLESILYTSSLEIAIVCDAVDDTKSKPLRYVNFRADNPHRWLLVVLII